MNPNELISQVLGITSQTNQSLVAGQEAMGQISQRMNTAGDSIQTSGLAQIEAQAEAARQSAAAKYATNIVHQNAQRMVGLDPNQIQNELTKSLASINEAKQAQDVLRAEWQGLQQTDFMSNPIGYVLNQFKSNDVARKHNAALEVEQAGYQNIQQRTALLNQVKTSVAANTADTLNAAALADAEAQRRAAEIKLAEANMQSLSRQGTLAMQQLDLAAKIGGNKLDTIKMVNTIQEQTENQAMRREQIETSRVQRAASSAQLELINAEKQAQAQAKLNKRVQVDAAGMALGYQQGRLTPEAIDAMKDRTVAAKLGSVANTMMFGPTIAEGVRLIAEVGDVPAIQRSNPALFDFLKKSSGTIYALENKIAATKDPKTLKNPTQEDARKQAAALYQAQVESSVGNPKADKPVNSPEWDTSFNPLRAQYKSLIDLVDANKIPGLEKNVVTSTVRSILPTKQGGDLGGADETTVFKTVAEQVKSGTLKPVDAARQVKQFYDVAAAQGADMFQYDRFNLPMPRSYYIQVDPAAQGIDLRSIASLEAAFAQYATKAVGGNANFGMFGDMVGSAFNSFINSANRPAVNPITGAPE